MIDNLYTEEQISKFLDYLNNTWKAVSTGVVSDTSGELSTMFKRYEAIHTKCEEAKAKIKKVEEDLNRITDAALKNRLKLIFNLVKDLLRFLDNAEEGSFRNLFFQAEHRQARAFAEIERRVDALSRLAGRIAAIWQGTEE